MDFLLNSTQQTFYTEPVTGNIPVWNRVFYAMFDVEIEFDEFSRILNEIIFENAMFRSSFYKDENNQIKQHINDYVEQEFECLNFNTKKELEDYAKNIVDCPTLICNNPLKLYVFKLGNKCGCLVRIHHILCDAMCMRIMINKLRAKLNLSESLESEKKLYPYEKIFDNEEKFINSPRYNKSIHFWNEKLQQGFESSIYGFTSSDDYSTDERWFDFDNKKITAVKQICVDNNIPFSAFVYFTYAVCVNKNIGLSKFSVGMPILNRFNNADMHTLGLFMHILPLIINIDENSSLLSALSNIYADILELAKYQRFTQYDIKKNCNCNHIQQLYDVFINYFPEDFLSNCEYDMFNSRFATAPLELCVREKNDGSVQLQVIYRNSLFKLKNIEEIVEQFNTIIDAFVENPNAIIKDINITSHHTIDNSERELILNQFNKTKHKYKNQSIKELFEEKAKENADKNAVLAVDKALTYQELNEEANKIANSLIETGIEKGDIVAFILPRRSYLVSTILGILKSGAVYLPIDPDYPKDRIEYMLNNSSAKLCITEENVFELLKNSNFQNPNINVSPENVCYCIYTSGSTGMSKGTLIKHSNVANYISDSYPNQMATVFKENNCESIVATTTVSFDIFVSESILPLCNDMTVILADEEQSKNQSKLNEITADAIQTTPTKMKMLMSNKSQLDYLKKLKVIILGGEAVDSDTVNNLKALTNARIYNYYGPTETTVWSTSTEITDINDITIGKPIANTRIYIVDDNMQITPIGVVGELCIAGDGVCLGYLNKPELTSEKFIDNPFGEGKLYKTGDLAYWREDGNIVYVGRNDFQVKIRGLRIELGEIENAINSVDGIEQSVVAVKKDNEDRQIVCAYYTGAKKTSSEIKKQISSKLPQYMLPHIFKHIEEMPTTSNGKLDRKALPEVDLNNIESAVEYVEAKSEEEKILVQAIKKVLNIDRVSLLDNFLDIGGDSLKSIELVAKLEASDYTINQRAIFDSATIKELATKIDKTNYQDVTVQYDKAMPATGLEMIVYTAQIVDGNSTLYNLPYIFKVDNLDVEKLTYAVNKMIERHESLRTHFENRDGIIYQVIDEPKLIKAVRMESDDLSLFVKPFDLTKSPLLRVGYYENTVMIDFHHIIADGESMPIFFNELNELYMGRELTVAPKQYGEFAATTGYTEENINYWKNVYSETISSINLNTDFPRPAIQSFQGNAVYDYIPVDLHNRITDKCRKIGITNYVYYMSAINLLFSKYSGNNDIVIGTPSNARTSRYINSIGMFVNTLAIRTKIDEDNTVLELLNEVKNESIDAIENQNFPFGNLVKLLGIDTKEQNLYNVMFTYQSEGVSNIVFADKVREIKEVPVTTAKTDLLFYVLPSRSKVSLMVEYCTKLYKKSTVERFIKSFKHVLEQMLDESKQVKDISVNCDYDLIVNKFNDTALEFPKELCIHQLFEEQAEKNPNRKAVVSCDRTLTYSELQKEVEKNCKKLQFLGVEKGNVVAVHIERNSSLIVLQLAVLKAGAIFLPVDKRYPVDRINYMCNDCDVKLFITDEDINTQAETTVKLEELRKLRVENAVKDETNNSSCYIIYTSGSTGEPKGCLLNNRGLVNFCINNNTLKTLKVNENNVFACVNSASFDYFIAETLFPLLNGYTTVLFTEEESVNQIKFLDKVKTENINVLMTTPTRLNLFFGNNNNCDALKQLTCICSSGEPLTSELLGTMYSKAPKAKIYNPLGPSECTVWDLGGELDKNAGLDVHLGKPIANSQVYILDKNLNPTPIGVTGEICIAGYGVGDGYVNRPELTAEKFIDNPFGEGKLYKTGDLAYWREDGNVLYVGRNDFQVKIRGLRIELGEIENAICSVNGVEQSAVVVKEDNNRQILCAFYTSIGVEAYEIKKQISSVLPKYMLPNFYTCLDAMPLTSSGKIDRKKLSQFEIKNVEVKSNKDVEPKTELEKYICNLFDEILGVENSNLESDFYDLGGNSLDIIRLLSYEKFEAIKVSDFMLNPTPKGLSEIVKGENVTLYNYLETLYMPDNAQKAIVLFPFGGGNSSGYSALVNEFKKNKSSIALYYVDWLNNAEDYNAASKEIISLSSNVDVSFYSHCAGSVIALKLLDILPPNVIKCYIAGAIVPPKKQNRINLWSMLSNKAIIKYLEKAGFKRDMLDDFVLDKMIGQFRVNTKEYQMYFNNKFEITNVNVISVISKYDPFTKNHKIANEIWKKYISNYEKTLVINSKSHYFQKDNAGELYEIITDIAKGS